MAFRTQKISQMTPKGANLEATDLIEVSTIESGSYVTRSITGQEIIDAAVGNVDWGDIGGTLSAQTDLQNALDAKQDDITLTTTGSSGASTLVGSTLNVPNYTLSGLGGVPTSRTLTINGVTQDLSANRTFTISTGITIGTTAITSGTVGRVLFEGTGNVVSESANLFWDNTNGRLGIGTSSPARALDIVKTIASGAIEGMKIEVNHSSSTSAGILDFIHTQFDARARIQSIAGAGGANPTLSFIIRSTTAMSILQSGNINIGTTTTDAGFRLDVNGTARVQGDLSSTGIITAQSRFTQLGSNANTFPGIINHMGAAQSVSGLNTTRICANTDLSVGFAGGADASAVIEARSTTKGFLPPRMTTTQKNAIASPAAGLMVYDTTLNVISYYNGSMWI